MVLWSSSRILALQLSVRSRFSTWKQHAPTKEDISQREEPTDPRGRSPVEWERAKAGLGEWALGRSWVRRNQCYPTSLEHCPTPTLCCPSPQGLAKLLSPSSHLADLLETYVYILQLWMLPAASTLPPHRAGPSSCRQLSSSGSILKYFRLLGLCTPRSPDVRILLWITCLP